MSHPERFLLRRDRAVQAGAGTGKTHALVTQYLHLCAGLSAHDRALEPRHIAAMTFTDKAAGEMLERLRRRVGLLLRAVAQGDEATAGAEPDLHRTAQLLSRQVPPAEHWERVLIQLGSAPVGTFHSFAGGLLRRYPALAGIDPDFVLFDQETALEMELEATERTVLAALEGDLDEVTADEAARLLAEYGFRGVGGGEALVEHLCRVRSRRAEEGLGPAGLAAGYSEEALQQGFARTRHDLLDGLRQLGEAAALLGGKSAEGAVELARAEEALRPLLGDVEGIAAATPLIDEVCAGLSRLRARPRDDVGKQELARVKAQLRQAQKDLEAVALTRQAAPLAATFERLCAAAWAAYDQAKQRAGGLDFTDLLYRTRDLLRDHPDERAAVSGRFAAILVDEFQDTNPLQAEVLELLAGPLAEHQPGRLYIVGDRKQSIYEFRGADVATFARLCGAIAETGGDEETLVESRRSVPGVLGLANALFAQVMQPPEEDGVAADQVPGWMVRWDPARDPLVPVRPTEAAGPTAELLREPESPESDQPDDPLGREADLVARKIVSLQKGGRRYGDMAVLLGRFTHLQRYLLALRQAGVPYYVVKGRGFYEAQEVRDLCAALTLIDDPEDVLSLVCVLRSPLCAVSDDTLVRLHLGGQLRLTALLDSASGRSLPDGVPADEADRLRRVVALLGLLLQRCDRLGPSGCLRALYDACDLPAILAAGPEGEQRVANLEMLLLRAQKFEEDGGHLRAFVRWLRLLVDPALGGDALAPQAQIVDERDDVVRVMTIHQAKGLEFPVVIIPGCASRERVDQAAIGYDREIGIGLSLRRAGERADTLPARQIRQLRRLRAEAESARLFYVATTRARDHVVFAGEGRGFTGTWRGHLEGLLGSPAGALLSIDTPPLLPAEVPPADLPEAPAGPEQARAAMQAVARGYRLAAPERPRGPLRVSLSAACDAAVCPRRHHLLHALHLEESAEPARAFASDEGAHHGTLAHRLLSRADFAQGGADVEGLLAADGHDTAIPAVAEVRTRVVRFLRSRFCQELLVNSGHSIRRALPFLIRLGPEVELRGQIDLLLVADGSVLLLDYHYGYAPQAEDNTLGRLRRDLLGHVGRVLLPGASSVRVGFVYLREPDPAPRLHETSPADEQAAVVALRDAVAGAAAGEGRILPLSRCTALGCGYRYRCHPA